MRIRGVGHPSGDRRRWRTATAARLATLASLASLAAFGAFGVSNAAAVVNPLLGSARLQGQFLLAGRITKATAVPGERKGQTVSRTWTFASSCASGPCSTVDLTRPRQTGTDRLVLALTQPGTYQGFGSFYAPLRCAGRLNRQGELVPFTVTVTVSLAVESQFGVFATRVNATYANRIRINRTRCVASLGSDAASYHGHLLPAGTTGGAPVGHRSPAGT